MGLGSATAVDRLAERPRSGYTATTGDAVTADWSTGSVGMIGKSYDGTLANGVAATGVAGLKTIVPISAISSWYDYYAPTARPIRLHPGEAGPEGRDRATADRTARRKLAPPTSRDANGDYEPLLGAARLRDGRANVRASVVLLHGVNDLNVKTIHFGQWWAGLVGSYVPRKLWLSQTGTSTRSTTGARTGSGCCTSGSTTG